jgi:hypothetical protein
MTTRLQKILQLFSNGQPVKCNHSYVKSLLLIIIAEHYDIVNLSKVVNVYSHINVVGKDILEFFDVLASCLVNVINELFQRLAQLCATLLAFFVEFFERLVDFLRVGFYTFSERLAKVVVVFLGHASRGAESDSVHDIVYRVYFLLNYSTTS